MVIWRYPSTRREYIHALTSLEYYHYGKYLTDILQSIARIHNATVQSIMPQRNTLRQTFSHVNRPAPQLLGVLCTVLHSVEGVSCKDSSSLDDGESILVLANRNTWSRSARRKKLSTSVVVNTNSISTEAPAPSLKCLIRCSSEGKHEAGGDEVLEVSWAQGKDRALFESFWSHVCRKVGSLLESEDR